MDAFAKELSELLGRYSRLPAADVASELEIQLYALKETAAADEED